MKKPFLAIFCLIEACLLALPAEGQVANVLNSVGAVNRGAATAMPLDASNSQFWNPASITELPVTELDLNVQPNFPRVQLEASLPPRQHIPTETTPQEIAGGGGSVLDSGNRFNIAYSLGFVKKLKQSPWAFGLLTAAVVGSGVKFKQSPNNPITSARTVSSSGDLIYISPAIAYKVTEHLSLGLSSNLVVSSLQADSFGGATPDDADHDGLPSYPPTNRAWATGVGVQGGIYYQRKNIHLGASLKSPQWFTPFHFKGKNEIGQPRHFSAQIGGPMILSMGTGYTGIPRVKLSADVRWVDYENTPGFDQVGFTPLGKGKGLGWQNIWAFIESAQYQLTENCIIRMNYSYSQDPVQPKFTSISIASPSLVKHQLGVALAYRFRPNMVLALSYQHGFANSSQGPIQRPSGPIPGSTVKVTSSLNSFAATLVFLFK